MDHGIRSAAEQNIQARYKEAIAELGKPWNESQPDEILEHSESRISYSLSRASAIAALIEKAGHHTEVEDTVNALSASIILDCIGEAERWHKAEVEAIRFKGIHTI